MSTQKPSLWGVLSDSARVIKSHFLHFLALAALFLLPLSIFTVLYPFLIHQSSIPPRLHRSLIYVSPPQAENKTLQTGNPLLLIPFFYIILELLFILSATASITYSALHGFFGKPVKFISSLKSILVSFFPLLGTILLVELIFVLAGLGVGIIAFLAYTSLLSLGFTMDYDSGYFLALFILMVILVLLALMYVQVEWYLFMVVVVVESKWGIQPLKRSSNLVKGMRGIVISLFLLFGIPSSLLAWWYMNVLKSMDTAGGLSWSSVVMLIVYAVVLTIISLYTMVAHTILYAYCKESHGETMLEIDTESGLGYAILPGDE